MSIQSALLDAHSTIHHTTSALSGVESIWSSFKDTITAACNKLLRSPNRQDADWVTDEVRNLSKRRKPGFAFATTRLHTLLHCTSDSVNEHELLLTRLGTPGSVHAEEAERQAAIEESLGRGGSLV